MRLSAVPSQVMLPGLGTTNRVLVIAALGCVSGCVGEAVVSYQGSVTAGATSGYRFSPTPNPSGAAPISGATVELCLGECDGQKVAITDANGHFEEISATFGGVTAKRISIRATAPDGRTFAYETAYEETTDPTVANPSCEQTCPPVFLNLQIAP